MTRRWRHADRRAVVHSVFLAVFLQACQAGGAVRLPNIAEKPIVADLRSNFAAQKGSNSTKEKTFSWNKDAYAQRNSTTVANITRLCNQTSAADASRTKNSGIFMLILLGGTLGLIHVRPPACVPVPCIERQLLQCTWRKVLVAVPDATLAGDQPGVDGAGPHQRNHHAVCRRKLHSFLARGAMGVGAQPRTAHHVFRSSSHRQLPLFCFSF
eukprot:2922999-Rhodomonas_salina.3